MPIKGIKHHHNRFHLIPCMIITEAEIILSFPFCKPATMIHSDAADY